MDYKIWEKSSVLKHSEQKYHDLGFTAKLKYKINKYIMENGG